jgi:glutamine amidotransferase/cyclase
MEWILSATDYGDHRYISMVQKGNVSAAQFHPEKSGAVGLEMIRSFLAARGKLKSSSTDALSFSKLNSLPRTILARRVIACLDVRSNDQGDLVVTKGDQYDVRENDSAGKGGVRNLGKPVALCKRYFDEGADEVVFLNITSFRQGVLNDLPMLQVLQSSSQNVFVPLTVGGGIREYTEPETGKIYSALEVAGEYFRAGADKISIGSDAVYSVEEYLQSRIKTGKSSIEQITR